MTLFHYIACLYNDQEPLLKDLNQCVDYRKIELFINSKGLHCYFERYDGNFEKAVTNANSSID